MGIKFNRLKEIEPMLQPIMRSVALWACAGMIAGCQQKPQAPPIGGVPFEEALKIVDRNASDLLQIPGVQGIGLSLFGIVVELDRSEVEVPQSIEGLPVTTGDPSGPSPSTPPPSRLLPPPSGVIVLRPGGVREAMQHCPADFTEKVVFEWRFCLDPHDPHPPAIPPLWLPPVAGVPFEKALEIWKRHATEIWRISGVAGVVLIANGIVVEAANLDIAIPRNVEGIPVGTRKFPLATFLMWKPEPCVVSDYEDFIFARRGENKVSAQHDLCKSAWAKVHEEANRRRSEMMERQAVAQAHEPDEPSTQAQAQQPTVPLSPEEILKRMPPPPKLDKMPELPPLPPRIEDIRPCKVGFIMSPQHGGACVPAPPGYEWFSTSNRPLAQTTVTTTDGREIPFREAYNIGVDHFDELIKLPGAGYFGFRLGINGIFVETDNLNDTSTWPKEVEGVPIVPVPRRLGQDVWTGGINLGSGDLSRFYD
jgi:hypothetical protein